MKLSTSLVAVKKINSAVPRSNFADDDLERAANLVLEAEGVINPIVLRRMNLDSYEVVDGDFEYYAAAKAREINPRKGEMIGAFIIEDENEKVIEEQVKLLRKQKPIVPGNGGSSLDGIATHLINLNSRIETLIKEFKDEQLRKNRENEDLLRQLEQLIEKKLEPIKGAISPKPKTAKKPKAKTIKPPEGKPLKEMTVEELRSIAKELKMSRYSKLTKPQLIAAIEETR